MSNSRDSSTDVIKVSDETFPDLEQAEKLLGIGDVSNLLVEKVVKSPRSANVYRFVTSSK